MQNSTLLEQYFRDLIPLKPLSREDEVELARKISSGSQEAKEKLVLANLRFVVSIARGYQNRGLPLVDLISAGNLGLIMAAERFDETRGFKFISYAVWWIRQAIRQSLAQDVRMIRMPVNRVALLGKIDKVCRELQQNGEVEPEPETLAEKLGVSKEMIQDTLMQAQKVRSLDVPLGEEGSNSLLQILSDKNQKLQDEEVFEDSVRRQIHEVLKTIDKREAEVLRLYFGLGHDAPMTLEQIGRRFNVTRERIRQIKEKALRRLQHPNRRAQLELLIEPA
jgi:RNA polymerase primary sigma factor